MHKKFANYFICPQCQAPLSLKKIFSKDADEICEGMFGCERNHFYPLIDSVPRLLKIESLVEFVGDAKLSTFIDEYFEDIPTIFIESIRKQKSVSRPIDASTAEFYSDMWKRYDTDFDVYDAREFERLTADNLPLASLRNKSTIDVGGGGGRYIKPLLLAEVNEVVCMDLGDAITLAQRKYSHDQRVLCVQADIYHSPFKNNFDFVLCIGVLQHLPDSSGGFAQLVRLAKPGGKIFVWVYGNSSIKSLLLIVRKACNKFPLTWLWTLSGFFAVWRLIVSKWNVSVSMFGGYKEGYNFHYFQTNTFDHLSAPIIDFFQRDTLEEWFKQSSITEYELIERFPRQANASWIIKACKCTQIT